MAPSDDSVSVSSISPSIAKKDWLQRWIQKLSQTLQTDENKKMLHVFVLDPILNHIFERLFPYILILCVLFVILTAMIILALFLIFTKIPGVFRPESVAL
jgi:hypothetical protein